MNADLNNSDDLCRKRGRPRSRRRIIGCGPWRCFAPQCNSGEETSVISVLPEEIEVLRLIDLEGMEQEEAAIALGVSRKTIWKDLHKIRAKITDALVNGKPIEIIGCTVREEGFCPKENAEFCPKGSRKHCIRGGTNKE